MSAGGKKDAIYNMEQFQKKVKAVDPRNQMTDCFYNAFNVQTAGAVSCATFPCAMCFHIWEHVLYLFFSDPSKRRAI